MRRPVDPVDRAFEHWRGLTTEQQQRLADRQYGWSIAMGGSSSPSAERVRRQPKKGAKQEVKAEGA